MVSIILMVFVHVLWYICWIEDKTLVALLEITEHIEWDVKQNNRLYLYQKFRELVLRKRRSFVVSVVLF